MSDWPFAERRNTAVFTGKPVWQDGRPILFVSHDAEDGAWQFHADEEPVESEASIISLEEILALDATLAALADLPAGWRAWRSSKDDPWHREKD